MSYLRIHDIGVSIGEPAMEFIGFPEVEEVTTLNSPVWAGETQALGRALNDLVARTQALEAKVQVLEARTWWSMLVASVKSLLRVGGV